MSNWKSFRWQDYWSSKVWIKMRERMSRDGQRPDITPTNPRLLRIWSPVCAKKIQCTNVRMEPFGGTKLSIHEKDKLGPLTKSSSRDYWLPHPQYWGPLAWYSGWNFSDPRRGGFILENEDSKFGDFYERNTSNENEKQLKRGVLPLASSLAITEWTVHYVVASWEAKLSSLKGDASFLWSKVGSCKKNGNPRKRLHLREPGFLRGWNRNQKQHIVLCYLFFVMSYGILLLSTCMEIWRSTG